MTQKCVIRAYSSLLSQIGWLEICFIRGISCTNLSNKQNVLFCGPSRAMIQSPQSYRPARRFWPKFSRQEFFQFFSSDDNLMPITVSNEDEEETFSSFSFAQIILKSQSKFPKTLPFSKSVLVIHQLLQKYIASGKFRAKFSVRPG